MRRFLNLFLLLLVVFSVNLNSQPLLVGDTTCNYVVLNKQINLPDGGSTLPYNYTTTYTIDVDGDSVDDIDFYWKRYGANAGSTSYWACLLKCYSISNYEFVYLPPVSGCVSTTTANIAQNLPYSSALLQSLNWSANPSNSYIYDYLIKYFGPATTCGNCSALSLNNPLKIYIGFRKILTNDTIYGWILLNSDIINRVDQVVSYGYKHTAFTSTVTPIFTNTLTSVCAGSALVLSANPPGGTFLGSNVSGNSFTPPITQSGIQTVYYSKGCSLAAISVTVNPAPPLSLINPSTLVCIGDSVGLNPSPSGGTFSGAGVSGNVFHSSVTGLGTSTLSYFYTDGLGCSNTKTFSLNVISIPSLTIGSTAPGMVCPGQSVTLTVNGASTYTWSTGAISQSITVAPSVNASYTVTGALASGGCPSGTLSVFLPVGNPTITVSAFSGTICPGTTGFLNVNGASNYVWSTGQTGGNIGITPTITTTYSVIGSNNGGACSDTAYVTQAVVPRPVLIPMTNDSIICPGNTALLWFNGASNVISYDVYDSITSQFIGSFAGGGSILFTPTITTVYKININYNTTNNTCFFNMYYTQPVKSCVGIKEYSVHSSYLSVFPNPSNGEFEIQGSKEEMVYISNELGQILQERKLSAENNYSAQISGLPQGVYIVGNNYRKQKIVVID